MNYKIFKRIPQPKHLSSVYGLIVMLTYGWSIYRFLWNLPSWVKFLTINEISVILAYTFVTNLIESLLILIGLVIVAAVLPAKWLQDDFIVRGGLSVFYLLGFVMFVSYNLISFDQLINNYLIRGVIDFVFLHFVIGYVGPLQSFIYSIADRATIFLYIYIPLSILSLIFVLIRNILV